MLRLLIVLLLTGCSIVEDLSATPVQSEAPAMPELVTDVGKACARSCQANYAAGNQSCGLIVNSAPQRAQCLNNSNQILAECYSTCE